MRADVSMRTPDSLDLSTSALDSGWFTVTIRQAVCRICTSSRMSHLCVKPIEEVRPGTIHDE